MTFKTGDKVRVTPEYAAWYKAKTGQETGVTPDTDLSFRTIEDTDGLVLDLSLWIPVYRLVPLEYLVSAESETP